MRKIINIQSILDSDEILNELFHKMRVCPKPDQIVYDFTAEGDMMTSRMAGLISRLQKGQRPDENWLKSMTQSYVLTDDPNYPEFYTLISEKYPIIKEYIDRLLRQYQMLTEFITNEIGQE